jgi:capsular exopolysaccharide synthesis family protein
VTILVVGVALFVSFQRTPIYDSEASVLVAALEFPGSTTPINPNLATEVEIASSIAVAKLVVRDLDLEQSPEGVLGGLSTSNPSDTEILRFGYSHSNPAEAQRRAQAFAEAYLDYRRQTVEDEVATSQEAATEELAVLNERLDTIQKTLADIDDEDPRRPPLQSEAGLLQGLILQRQLDLIESSDVAVGTIVEPAILQQDPSSPNHVANAAFGLAAGLALGLGLAFLRDRLAGRLRTDHEVEASFGAPILGRVPAIAGWRRRKEPYLVTRKEWRSPAAESYRILRTNLLSIAATHGVKTILVTSSHIGEGKTATSANLAIALTRAGKRVVLISADLRRPRLDKFFSARSPLGLTDFLRGRIGVEKILVRPQSNPTARGLDDPDLILSGSKVEDTAELLGGDRMAQLLTQVKKRADLVIIDAPPILPVTDAVILSRLVDGVLFVVGPKSATDHALSSSREHLDKVDATVLGVVLNGTDFGVNQAYYTY